MIDQSQNPLGSPNELYSMKQNIHIVSQVNNNLLMNI